MQSRHQASSQAYKKGKAMLFSGILVQMINTQSFVNELPYSIKAILFQLSFSVGVARSRSGSKERHQTNPRRNRIHVDSDELFSKGNMISEDCVGTGGGTDAALMCCQERGVPNEQFIIRGFLWNSVCNFYKLQRETILTRQTTSLTICLRIRGHKTGCKP